MRSDPLESEVVSDGRLIVEWMKNLASQNNFKISNSIYGEFVLTNKKVTQNVGSVYGIWVKLNSTEKDELWNDILKINSKKNITDKENFLPIVEKWYPLYWGKDINPGSRIRAHANKPKGTSSLDLPKYKSLKKITVIYGNILVEKYYDFEKLLHSKYIPLLGDRRRGNTSKMIIIMN